jgi:hypothetical protein
MIQLLAFCLATSLAITAIHVTIVWPGMLLNFIEPVLSHRLPVWLKKPLYECMICMASIWTIVFSFAFGFKPPSGVWGLAFAVLVVAGVNTLVCVGLEKLSDYGC